MQELVVDEEGQRSLYEARLARCIPVAKKILALIDSHLGDIKLGEEADVRESMAPIAQEILALFLAENIRWADKDFILALTLQPSVTVNEIVTTSLGISWDKAISKKFGKDSLDLTFQEVDDCLKS